MAVGRRRFVSLDCGDAKPPAEFWAAILGSESMFTIASATVGVPTDWAWLSSIQGADYSPPTWPAAGVPKQIHLDLPVNDLETAVVESERRVPRSRWCAEPPTGGQCCSTPLEIPSA